MHRFPARAASLGEIAVMAALLAASLIGPQKDKPVTEPGAPLYEEDIAASDPIRTEQARELDKYLAGLRAGTARRGEVFTPDYSSPAAFEKSTRNLRQALRASLGFPPPGSPDPEPPSFVKAGQDEQGVYYRFRISILPGVHSVGFYIVPTGLKGRAPLVIAMHGGGGSPEIATFHGGANYHDMIRGAVARGYAVFAPQHLFTADGFPPDFRQRVDARARLVGTTITAIEIAKITRGLDVVLKRPEVDASRVAMIGLSYGGFYTLYTTALEPRIKVAVSSCYFSDRAELLDKTEPFGWADWRFTNGLSLFSDPDIVALICPRPLQVQVGSRDELFPIAAARRTAPLAAEHYRRLNLADRFRFDEFPGGHEFHGEAAWEFLKQHL
jgi:dienelactone hydrolase